MPGAQALQGCCRCSYKYKPHYHPQAIPSALDTLPGYGELKQRAAAVRASPGRQLELLPSELERLYQVGATSGGACPTACRRFK